MKGKKEWDIKIEPLIKLYATRKHPLDYRNRYQLLVMVILSASDSDRHINQLSEKLFQKYPSFEHLAGSNEEELYGFIGSVRNSSSKIKWILEIARGLGDENNIPKNLEGLVKLPGIGRKSANVILRESGLPPEGIIVDLHVVRVAPRIGIASSAKPEKIEKELMLALSREIWGEAGMSISFLGRETCRPSNPKCGGCVMNRVCRYYSENN